MGIIKKNEIIHSRAPKGAGEEEYDVILIGKPTDSSGLGGVTFASEALREEDEATNRGAVQIPDPFLKNVLFKANDDLFRLVRKRAWRSASRTWAAAGYLRYIGDGVVRRLRHGNQHGP